MTLDVIVSGLDPGESHEEGLRRELHRTTIAAWAG